MAKLQTAVTSGRGTAALERALRSWYTDEVADWDAVVDEAAPAEPTPEHDLWDDMPTIDSKAVARASPIFERHLGVSLDTKLIRPGGYRNIEDMITDLVPQMASSANDRRNRHGE